MEHAKWRRLCWATLKVGPKNKSRKSASQKSDSKVPKGCLPWVDWARIHSQKSQRMKDQKKKNMIFTMCNMWCVINVSVWLSGCHLRLGQWHDERVVHHQKDPRSGMQRAKTSNWSITQLNAILSWLIIVCLFCWIWNTPCFFNTPGFPLKVWVFSQTLRILRVWGLKVCIYIYIWAVFKIPPLFHWILVGLVRVSSGFPGIPRQLGFWSSPNLLLIINQQGVSWDHPME